MRLMMLAFLSAQIRQRGCRLFPAALAAVKSKRRFRRKLRGRFDSFRISSWEVLSHSIINPPDIPLIYDTS